MDWPALETEIKNSFTTCKLTLPEGRVLIPREVIHLENAVSKYASSEEDQELIECEGAAGLIDERWSMQDILTFEWGGLGPITWHLGLCTFEIGTGRKYVCMAGEEEYGGLSAVAALEPMGDTPLLFQPFFKDLLADNGESYGYTVFGSLPTMTRNRRPDLLPTPSGTAFRRARRRHGTAPLAIRTAAARAARAAAGRGRGAHDAVRAAAGVRGMLRDVRDPNRRHPARASARVGRRGAEVATRRLRRLTVLAFQHPG